jgi:hypothetical protein
MFSVEIRFKVGDREVSLERFATLFLNELLRSAQHQVRQQRAPAIRPAVVAAPDSKNTKELEPPAVGLKHAAFLLGVREPTVRKHVRQGTIPSLRGGGGSLFQ